MLLCFAHAPVLYSCFYSLLMLLCSAHAPMLCSCSYALLMLLCSVHAPMLCSCSYALLMLICSAHAPMFIFYTSASIFIFKHSFVVSLYKYLFSSFFSDVASFVYPKYYLVNFCVKWNYMPISWFQQWCSEGIQQSKPEFFTCLLSSHLTMATFHKTSCSMLPSSHDFILLHRHVVNRGFLFLLQVPSSNFLLFLRSKHCTELIIYLVLCFVLVLLCNPLSPRYS